MKRLMRYKTLQCFLAALVMIAFLAPSAYASGAPDTYEASANAVSEKYIGKTVPGACVVISEHDNTPLRACALCRGLISAQGTSPALRYM